MPKLKLTKQNIDKVPLQESGQADYFDTKLRGFMLRVGKESKTFYIQADVLDAATGKHKTVKEKIGRYGEWTPEQASTEAASRLRLLRMGKGKKATMVPTLDEMLKIHLADNPFRDSTAKVYRSEIPAKFPDWLSLPLDQIVSIPAEVMIDRFRRIEKDHGPMAAKNTFGKLQSILNYARTKYPAVVTSNPCSVLVKLWPKTKSRGDCLRGDDFHVFHDGVQQFNEFTRDATIFCLYQGLRNKEASGLKWEHVDLERGTLTIPITKTVTLYVPLCRQSLSILSRRKENNVVGPFVFPTLKPHLNKSGHIVLMSHELRKNTGLDITYHGLRRTFITTGKKLGLHEEAERLTNHVDATVTGKHYDCRDVDDLRGPLQQIADRIELLMMNKTE